MKHVIFSRKGFDSSSGGAPSPLQKGSVRSVPIPARDRSLTTYGDIGLGDVVTRITNGRITGADYCHFDPMFERGRCAFGQTGAAQTHLANQGVGIGDVFLFFGLFSNPDGKAQHHRIFGYLKVAEVHHLGSRSSNFDQPSGFSHRHPHTLGSWHKNNTIYVGEGYSANAMIASLRLSSKMGRLSVWDVPNWLFKTGLSYHPQSASNATGRWSPNGTLQTVGRGQEFVADISRSKRAQNWVQRRCLLIRESCEKT